MPESARLIPLNIAARKLRVPLRWLKGEAEAGRIPSIRAERQFLCDLASVEAALLKRARHNVKK